jgi:hypothetical protein
MDVKEKSTKYLQNRLVQLQSKYIELFPFMRGSIVQIGMTQKRPHYSLNIKGKTKIISLGKGKEAVAKKWIENYKSLQEIIEEVTMINIELIRRMDFPIENST